MLRQMSALMDVAVGRRIRTEWKLIHDRFDEIIKHFLRCVKVVSATPHSQTSFSFEGQQFKALNHVGCNHRVKVGN